MSETTTITWNRLRILVQNRDKSICYYCKQITPKGHCDHVLPLSMGGTDAIDNLVWSCEQCNQHKPRKKSSTPKPVPQGSNTKERSEQIFNTAASVLEAAGGCVKIDQLSLEDRWPVLNKMYEAVMSQTGCVRETAKRNIAKALRRARYGEMIKRGGARPGPHPGRPKKESSQDES